MSVFPNFNLGVCDTQSWQTCWRKISVHRILLWYLTQSVHPPPSINYKFRKLVIVLDFHDWQHILKLLFPEQLLPLEGAVVRYTLPHSLRGFL